jgi:hypothetical protein
VSRILFLRCPSCPKETFFHSEANFCKELKKPPKKQQNFKNFLDRRLVGFKIILVIEFEDICYAIIIGLKVPFKREERGFKMSRRWRYLLAISAFVAWIVLLNWPLEGG